MLYRMDATGEIQTPPTDLRLQIFRNREPQCRGLQALLWKVQGLFAQDLLTEEALARKRDNLRGDLDFAKGCRGRSPGSLFQGLQDVEVGGGPRLRIVVGVARQDRSDPTGQVQLPHYVCLSLMQVHSAGMHLL